MDIEAIAPLKRCAIYTRKSTNQRLEHDVNSLVTQREISSAYIKSQQYKGWVELPDRYDDGGHSGSGLDRPALSQLMQDIEAGEIDVVVVYKIDRLTRSLADFVRMIEIFDGRNIALVSISQAFDTSDSMGRTLIEQGRKRRVSASEALIVRQLQQGLSGNRLSANQLLADGRAAERRSRADAEARYSYWRHWLRTASEVPLYWPPDNTVPAYPHPRDVWIDHINRQVEFKGPMVAEEVGMFRNIAVARDILLGLAERAGRNGNASERTLLLGDAAVTQALLAPSFGGLRPDEPAALGHHRLTTAAMAMRVLSTAKLDRHIAALEAMLEPPPRSSIEETNLQRMLRRRLSAGDRR